MYDNVAYTLSVHDLPHLLGHALRDTAMLEARNIRYLNPLLPAIKNESYDCIAVIVRLAKNYKLQHIFEKRIEGMSGEVIKRKAFELLREGQARQRHRAHREVSEVTSELVGSDTLSVGPDMAYNTPYAFSLNSYISGKDKTTLLRTTTASRSLDMLQHLLACSDDLFSEDEQTRGENRSQSLGCHLFT